jgi:hypothetical protein
MMAPLNNSMLGNARFAEITMPYSSIYIADTGVYAVLLKLLKGIVAKLS